MTALYLYRRRVAFHASEPRRPANDDHCVTALIFGANDNPLFGRPFGGPAA